MTDISYELYEMRGPSPGSIYALKDTSMTIGRDPLSDILINDPEVSRQHALLIRAPSGDFRIQDLGSTNGTFVDGERLRSNPFTLERSNQVVLGGGVTLIFRERSIDDQAKPMGSDELRRVDNDEVVRRAAPESKLPPRPVQQAAQEKRPQAAEVKKPRTPAGQSLKEAGQAQPLYQHQQQAANIDTGNDIPGPDQIGLDMSEGVTPNLILGVVLLLLCCSASMLLFLVYSGGDSLLRQMGLVP